MKHVTKIITLALTFSLTFSPIVPALATDALDMQATAGDTAKALPDVGNVCKRLTDATEGNFINTDNSPILVTKDSCLGSTRRERNAPSCKVKISELTANLSKEEKQKVINKKCQDGSGSLGQAGDAYCNLRKISENSQAKQYCEAFTSADKAASGLKWILALDAAAAATCWAEYISMKMAAASGGVSAGGVMNSGACGGVALAAATGEIAQTIKVLTPGNNSAGNSRVDESGNVKDRNNFMKTIEVIASAGLSLKAIQVGVCYYNANAQIMGLDICRGLNNREALKAGNSNKKIQMQSNNVKHVNSEMHREEKKLHIKNSIDAANDLKIKKAALDQAKNTTISVPNRDEYKKADAETNQIFQTNESNVTDVDDYEHSKRALAQAKNTTISVPNRDEYKKADAETNQNFQTNESNVTDVDDYAHSKRALALNSKKNSGLVSEYDAALNRNNAAEKKIKELHNEEDQAIEAKKSIMARAELAQQAAIIFTGLAAMRGLATVAAENTKKKTTDLLQSMFQGGGSGPSFGATAMQGNGANLFAATAAVGFPNTGTQPVISGATAMPPDSVEKFMLPPGSPISQRAETIAKQIPDSKLNDAASGGAGGVGGLISGMASSMGARGDLGQIHSTVASVFANLPKEDGGYNGGGGGGHMASGSGGKDNGGLDLKSLFGQGGEKEEATSPGRTDIAFREPAAVEDIWHTQNPNGNNLFQIVSDKYDRVQRRSAVGEGL